ncbi:MAG: hypothetical protein IJZ61_07080, partial [Oscillospiraceae bacterium]|nr:hypothetical protein [Oscillospiraceae bacterium]
ETLAVQGYTDIVIYTADAYFAGNPARSVNMRMICEDGYKGTIRMSDVNIFGLEGPVLTLGKKCDVTLEISGNNTFSYEGIRVPESSKFTLKGDGDLKIDVSSDDGTVFGGNYFQDFGEIYLEHTGNLNIYAETTNIVAIGGSVGGENSLIDISAGHVFAELRGVNTVGVGSVSGNVIVKLHGEKVSVDSAGRNVVAVGSMNGKTTVECETDVFTACAGDRCCAVGTLDGGCGSVVLNKGKYELSANAKNASVIGAVNGDVNVTINGGEYVLSCEGNDVTGIGGKQSRGNIEINGANMKLHTAASAELGIGTAEGKVVISAIDIIYDGRGKINATASNGEPLDIISIGENLVELHHKAV